MMRHKKVWLTLILNLLLLGTVLAWLTAAW